MPNILFEWGSILQLFKVITFWWYIKYVSALEGVILLSALLQLLGLLTSVAKIKLWNIVDDKSEL